MFRFFVLITLSVATACAATIHTQIPPFTAPGLATVKGNLTPQSTPVQGPRAVAAIQFGLNTLDQSTTELDVGATSAHVAGTWTDYPSTFAEARVRNGELGIYARVTAADFTANALQAHSRATFRDALTVTMEGLPLGTAGYLLMEATLDGAFNCDEPRGICNTGFLFGYGPGTLGSPDFVHTMGGEQPYAGIVSTTQPLVPLPFQNGQPFNISLELITTARLHKANGVLQGTYNITDFLHTMRISEVSVTDQAGGPVAFSITSSSGLLYGPAGVSAVPEPNSMALSAIGLVAWAATRFRRKSES